MNVLVMGGTGVMGSYLVDLLQQLGHDVIVTTRQSFRSNETVSYWQCDARKECFLDELKNKHFDAIVDFMNYGTDEFKNRAKELLGSTDQYVFLSSARVFSDSEQPITEKNPKLLDTCQDQVYLHTDEYALAKARQEHILQMSSLKNWTIIRPYITYGHHRFQLEGMEKEEWLYRALQGRTVLVSKDILEKRTMMSNGRDVAKAIAALIGNEKAKNEDFNVTGMDGMTWREVLQIYAKVFQMVMGKDMKIKEVESAMSIHQPWAKFQLLYDRMYNRIFSNSKIRQYADVSFEPMASGICTAFTEFMNCPRFKPIDWKMEVRKDRLTGECVRLTEVVGAKAKVLYFFRRYSAFG